MRVHEDDADMGRQEHVMTLPLVWLLIVSQLPGRVSRALTAEGGVPSESIIEYTGIWGRDDPGWEPAYGAAGAWNQVSPTHKLAGRRASQVSCQLFLLAVAILPCLV